MPAHSHNTTSDARTQCLLLAPRGRQTPPEILEGLRQRRVDVHDVNDPPAVMVALARRSIATLVIVEPAVWPRLNELIEAIHQYHPAIALWQYQELSQPRLSHYGPPKTQSPSPQAADAQPVKRIPAPAAATNPAPIDVRPPAGFAVPPGVPGAGAGAGVPGLPGRWMRDLLAQDDLRLTEEELAMLLGDDDVGPEASQE